MYPLDLWSVFELGGLKNGAPKPKELSLESHSGPQQPVIGVQVKAGRGFKGGL